jgi:hypothetical protein
MRSFGLGDGAVAQVVGTIALPISEGVLANRRGEHSRAVDLMKPILDRMYRSEEVTRANAHPLIVAALFLAIAIGLIGLAMLGAVSLEDAHRDRTEQKHRERNTCIIRLPSQGGADLRRDARRCDVRRRAVAIERRQG